MNRRRAFSFVIILAVIFAAGAATQAQAQSLKVDFPFVVGTKTLPAGTYTVAVAGDKMTFTSDKGTTAEAALDKTFSGKKVQKTKLVFDLVGSLWFMTEAWTPENGGSSTGSADGSSDRRTVELK